MADLEQLALDFHNRNPHVYELFVQLAKKAARTHDTLSAAQIWEVMRWEYSFRTDETGIDPDTGNPLKLNNNHRTYYARWFMEEYPALGARFKTRVTSKERKELYSG